jgi:RNA ligase
MGGQNRIVVDYGDYEGLVLLAAFDTKSGVEINRTELEKLDGFEVVTTYKTWGEGYNLLKEEISKDREGYVIKFKNGFRMKIKGDEYVRLHRILTNISNRDIWEYLKNEKPLDEILDNVPDEFYGWVKETVKDFVIRYENIEKDYIEIFNELKNRNLERKDFAFIVKHYRHSGILFNMLDEKDYKQYIWKILFPPYSKPFKKNEN